MEIHLVRHTTVAIEKGICYGQADIPVSATFESEANALALKLEHAYDSVYVSPLQRCTQLAKFLSLGELQQDARLREINFGDWELQSWNALERNEIDAWSRNLLTYNTHNGETLLELHTRVLSFIQELLEKKKEKVLIVTHAGVIRMFYQFVLQFPIENAMKMPIQFGNVHVLQVDKNASNCWIQTIK